MHPRLTQLNSFVFRSLPIWLTSGGSGSLSSWKSVKTNWLNQDLWLVSQIVNRQNHSTLPHETLANLSYNLPALNLRWADCLLFCIKIKHYLRNKGILKKSFEFPYFQKPTLPTCLVWKKIKITWSKNHF